MTIDDNSTSPSSTFLGISSTEHNRRNDDDLPRRRLSSTSSIIKSKTTGLLSCSTSSLVGDMVLTSDDVIKLKDNLRRTGLVDQNQTLRRKPRSEPIQIDFRGVLRSLKTNPDHDKR